MQNWVDFAAIKGSVELAPLLRHYQVKLRRSGRDQYRGCCPIHDGDSREAFHANLSQNVFHCFACGAGGTVLDFVAAMERCSLRDAALKLWHVKARTANPRPPVQNNWLRKKASCFRLLASRCAASIARIPIWLREASKQPRRSDSVSACMAGRGSSEAAWSFLSIISAESWSPTVAAPWMEPSRAIGSLQDSPNRRWFSTSIAPPRPASTPWSSWKASSTV
jgi:hypothetical protein